MAAQSSSLEQTLIPNSTQHSIKHFNEVEESNYLRNLNAKIVANEIIDRNLYNETDINSIIEYFTEKDMFNENLFIVGLYKKKCLSEEYKNCGSIEEIVSDEHKTEFDKKFNYIKSNKNQLGFIKQKNYFKNLLGCLDIYHEEEFLIDSRQKFNQIAKTMLNKKELETFMQYLIAHDEVLEKVFPEDNTPKKRINGLFRSVDVATGIHCGLSNLDTVVKYGGELANHAYDNSYPIENLRKDAMEILNFMQFDFE